MGENHLLREDSDIGFMAQALAAQKHDPVTRLFADAGAKPPLS